MILKNSLVAFFAFFSLAIQAQTEITTEVAVTEFKVATDTFEELVNFDWDIVAEMFEANTPETEIKIIIAYNQKVKFNKIDVDNFSLEVDGKTSQLTSLISKTKGVIDKLSDVIKN